MPQAAKIAEENGFGDVISYIQGKAEREPAEWLRVCVQLVITGVTSYSTGVAFEPDCILIMDDHFFFLGITGTPTWDSYKIGFLRKHLKDNETW